ncbi:C2H2 type zinc finger domain-containing protein 4 [Elsinoe australis]|uniref:C2H2 type zinc finger domain-containing protein 4 n=1 Tax=Elsinoe australis TaxID=40998 RepID=A0A4U7BCA5_9PEZI|nr:C2H2 type zinc finger domain-containing protein 4 [Elsinoe australis]
MQTATRYLVDDYLWRFLSMDGFYMDPLFKLKLGTREQFDQACQVTPLAFAPGLSRQLHSLGPPPISFFYKLTPPMGKVWALYAHVMRKPGVKKSRVYFGIGTEQTEGVRVRIRQYKPGNHALPSMVRKAFREGWTIRYTGLVCWCPIPDPAHRPIVRILFKVIEAALSAMFYVQVKTVEDHLWEAFMPWTREQVEYGPLCSHSAVKEEVRSAHFHLSAEELEYLEEVRKEHRRLLMRGYGKTHHKKRLAEDPVGYRREKADTAMRSYNKDPIQGAAKQRTQKAKTRASGVHFCPTCNQNFDSPSALAKHERSNGHQDAVDAAAAGVTLTKSTVAIAGKAFADLVRTEKRHHCDDCDHPAASPAALKVHKQSKRHAVNVKRNQQLRAARLAASAAAAAEDAPSS